MLTNAALGTKALYDKITTKEGGKGEEANPDCEEINSEEYKEDYGIDHLLTGFCISSNLYLIIFIAGDKVPKSCLIPPTHNDCNKLPCRGGCICTSLISEKGPKKHCEHPECMLYRSCILPKEIASLPKVTTSIISDPDDEFYQKNGIAASPKAASANANKLKPRSTSARKNVQKKAPPVKAAAKVKVSRGVKRPLVMMNPLDDPKLKQECYVKLAKLDIEDWMKRKAGPNDQKLLHGKPFVRLYRLAPSPDHSVYCMDHKVRDCPCI